MVKYKVSGSISVAVETWFEDSGKLDLRDQAMEAIENAANISKSFSDDVDSVDIVDVKMFSMSEIKGE